MSASMNSQASSATIARPSSLTKRRALLLAGVSRIALISRSSLARLGLRPEPTTEASECLSTASGKFPPNRSQRS
jgi:hypothetical protein